MFTGNQPGYASEVVQMSDGASSVTKRVRAVGVPAFRETGVVVLCDITSPEYSCYPIKFK